MSISMSTLLTEFERFPRRPLIFRFNRRQLLANVKQELVVAQGEQEGGTGYKLSMLGSLPDAQLEPIIPMIIPGCRISVRDGIVHGKRPGWCSSIELFPTDDTILYAFNWINGRTSLRLIAQHLGRHTGWEPANSFAFTRGLFLHLVQLRVCIPRQEVQAS